MLESAGGAHKQSGHRRSFSPILGRGMVFASARRRHRMPVSLNAANQCPPTSCRVTTIVPVCGMPRAPTVSRLLPMLSR